MGDASGFKKVIYFTKWSVYLAVGWPPPRLATKSQILKYDIALVISIISTICTLVPLSYSIYVYRHDSILVANSVALASALCSLIVKLIVMRLHRKQMQMFIEEMESFVKQRMRPNEETIFQRYVSRFSPIHTFIFVSTYISGCLVIVEPLVLSDQFLPMNAVYPFNVDSGIVMYLIYIQQSMSTLQAAAGLSIDGQAAIIMWYAGARLEILAEELGNITDPSGLQYFVREHKRLMSYALEVSNTMCYIVFTSSTTIALTALMSGIQIISNAPIVQKLPFGLAAAICSLVLFISASPADNLINVCNLMATAVYNTRWIDMSTDMMKSLLIILRRCQHPITVSIAGVMPALSLEFYGSFLSKLFSYFTALRVMMMAGN